MYVNVVLVVLLVVVVVVFLNAYMHIHLKCLRPSTADGDGSKLGIFPRWVQRSSRTSCFGSEDVS